MIAAAAIPMKDGVNPTALFGAISTVGFVTLDSVVVLAVTVVAVDFVWVTMLVVVSSELVVTDGLGYSSIERVDGV